MNAHRLSGANIMKSATTRQRMKDSNGCAVHTNRMSPLAPARWAEPLGDDNFICEGSNCVYPNLSKRKTPGFYRGLAADEGFEPSQTESESGVLPLH